MSDTTIEVATDPDINAPDAEGAPRPPSPREEIMARIASRRMEQIEADNAQAAIYDRDATEAGLNFAKDEPEPVQAEVEPARQEAPPPTRESAPAQPPAAPTLHPIDMDGQRVYVTDEQIAHLARLGMVANVALHQYQQPQRTPEPIRNDLPPIVDPDAIRAVVRAMQYSGEDDAATALTQLVTGVLARAAPAPVDQNDIIRRAVSESELQRRLASDTDTVRQEYPEIFADPQRTLLAKLNVDAIRARDVALGRVRPDLDVYREAGDAVYTALGRSRPGSETNSPSPSGGANVVPIRQDVIERKRNAPRATQIVDVRAPQPTQARPPTGADIVEQMRKSRGQSSMR